MRLTAVRVDLRSNTPVLLLEELQATKRSLPIFIGAPEATAIAFAIQKVQVPRPMTHDLMRDLLACLGARVVRVVVTDIVDEAYIAEIHLEQAGREVLISARPSDAIALAARVAAPIYVTDDLMDARGVLVEDDGDNDDGEPSDLGGDEQVPSEVLVDEFLSFLDNVKPEDFSS